MDGRRRLGIAARREDIPCRYGGEEFAIILPEMTAEKALERTETWRAALGKMRIEVDGKSVRAADAALYRAKRAGRDRALVSDVGSEAAAATGT